MLGKRVYRAFIHYDASEKKGVGVFCMYGHLSECGQWVEGGDTRWRRTSDWFDTEAEAKASKSGEIARIGARLLSQATELLNEASREVTEPVC